MTSITLKYDSVNNVSKYILHCASYGLPMNVTLVNLYSLSIAKKNSNYSKLLLESNLNLIDGNPIVKLMRFSRGTAHSNITQVRGIDLLRNTLKLSTDYNLRHLFLGTSAEIHEKLKNALAYFEMDSKELEFLDPGLVIQESLLSRDLLSVISDLRVDIVWVGLGTPTQDFVSRQLALELGTVAIGVGAAFEMLAGTKREASSLLRGLGLEWFFRLIQEPKRLWRRYLIHSPRALNMINSDKVKVEKLIGNE